MTKTFLIGTLVVTLTVLVTGCDGDNVKVYHVEKDDATAPPAPAPALLTEVPSAGAEANIISTPVESLSSPLKYTLPNGWKKAAPTGMRVASFGISENGKTADVSVIPLSGLAGGDVANVNRWRGQIGLPPLAEADLQQFVEKAEVAGQPADLYDAAGTKQGSSDSERLVGVIFHRGDTSWFFKMTGDADLVEKQKPAFVSFLKSLQFGGLAAPSTMDLTQLPAEHPAIPGMEPGTATVTMADAGDKPAWVIPAGWNAAALSQFLLAKFSINGDGDTKADVNVSVLAGEGGGLLSNVNRWRRQLGLETIEPGDLNKFASTMDANGSQATIVDFIGTDARTGQRARLVGVVLPLGGQTWFYKLMGDENIVARQKDAFTKFIQTAKYPDAH